MVLKSKVVPTLAKVMVPIGALMVILLVLAALLSKVPKNVIFPALLTMTELPVTSKSLVNEMLPVKAVNEPFKSKSVPPPVMVMLLAIILPMMLIVGLVLV